MQRIVGQMSVGEMMRFDAAVEDWLGGEVDRSFLGEGKRRTRISGRLDGQVDLVCGFQKELQWCEASIRVPLT